MRIDRHRADTGGPRIVSASGSWTYTDPAVHARALRLDNNHGLNLAAIDDWIEAAPFANDEQLARVLDWRNCILQAGDDHGAEGWAMYLLTLAALNVRERFLHPYALVGRWVKPRIDGKEPGERVTLRIPKQTASQRKARNKGIAQLAASGLDDAQIGSRTGLSARQVGRIRKQEAGD